MIAYPTKVPLIKYFFFSAIFLTTLSIATICASTILQTCYRKGKDISSLSGGNSTLKTLVGGSTTEVKGVIGDRRISSCLAQLQKLDLPREKRRRINRKFVICLAAGQAKAFAKLKKLARKETAKQIIVLENWLKGVQYIFISASEAQSEVERLERVRKNAQ